MTGEYTDKQAVPLGAELTHSADLQRVRDALAKIPMADQVYIAIPFVKQKRDPELNKWVPVPHPETGKPIEFPALIPVEEIEACPVPLDKESLSDEALTQYLIAATDYRKDTMGKFVLDDEGNRVKENGVDIYQGEDPDKITAGYAFGQMLIKQAARKKANPSVITNE